MSRKYTNSLPADYFSMNKIIWFYSISIGKETAQLVEIHPQEKQEPDFCMVNNTSVDGLVTQVSKAPASMIWTWY